LQLKPAIKSKDFINKSKHIYIVKSKNKMAKAPGQVAKGISVGLNKGFVTTKLSAKSLRARPSYAKGKLGKRTSLVR
jgi:hypothetical protein